MTVMCRNTLQIFKNKRLNIESTVLKDLFLGVSKSSTYINNFWALSGYNDWYPQTPKTCGLGLIRVYIISVHNDRQLLSCFFFASTNLTENLSHL